MHRRLSFSLKPQTWINQAVTRGFGCTRLGWQGVQGGSQIHRTWTGQPSSA